MPMKGLTPFFATSPFVSGSFWTLTSTQIVHLLTMDRVVGRVKSQLINEDVAADTTAAGSTSLLCNWVKTFARLPFSPQNFNSTSI